MYVSFDADYIMNMVYHYLYDDISGRNEDVYDIVERLVEDSIQELYQSKLPHKVLKGLQGAEDSEETAANEKAFKKISRDDIGYVAANFGFLFGLVYAEKSRLKFTVEENEGI